MSDTVEAPSRCHPATWRGLGHVELGVATETQRCLDLLEVNKLAEALGVKIDIYAAIKSSASVSDLLSEIKDELIARNRDCSVIVLSISDLGVPLWRRRNTEA